jgi:hypothetical protein
MGSFSSRRERAMGRVEVKGRLKISECEDNQE